MATTWVTRERLLKCVLGVVAVYHIFLGLLTFISPELSAPIVENAFGMHMAYTPALGYIARVLGIYAAMFGGMAAWAATDPQRHSLILQLVPVAYALRFVNRALSYQEFQTSFQATDAQIITDLALMAFFGLSVYLLKPKKQPV